MQTHDDKEGSSLRSAHAVVLVRYTDMYWKVTGGPLNSNHHHGEFSHFPTPGKGERHTITLRHHGPNKIKIT